ncbi:dihydroneopterin aldolase [Sulfitobacter pseudonitzschiae]|uniref:dihydroneopterin aldolase n=1 Tax=Pseudosulfitobacter pseudonitzschiae TaxID=1402135 RepID=A0A9Q2P1P4_9RHOB|nr:dihydroneopterin aldolase [Pseudosulfitobacter pseudonitzschiae]MBM2292323.1 dihydroneopterin aldolase [Pseudosulfitobacter pseudonitzschiae]MBM2297241.1 dihydroneopterin aldolase [Pseudosulfitobacter pseudonitzschiae]MBM2302155.1 dihydroneopterin aldolase [Pseudosulfitobacter pseudonitzschiae]MBM2311937.1 dihydroneopterin aldolase [Pseudosulfitobacter pseudonitzschiae]MBM2316851.1 dihydroneopterin aldolase [Pseudosulfitobacter pseudonitzschiae]|tara:strand:+ start:2463 stop:3383 length:921 start_codon:yes stop_codon:yes gene_type:complete
MASEIHLAFAHPSERSVATDDGMPLDRISVRDYAVDVEIGAFQAERGKTQRIKFNIVVEVQPLTGPIDDDVDRILSYDKVTEAIAHELADERLNLLETLAERVADRILIEPQAVRAFVRIEKLDRGPGALGVEIVRARTEDTQPADEEETLHPELVFFGNAAIASPHLTGWIDQLQAAGRPLIFCVGPSDVPAPQTGHRWTQRRIDLLAIEQNAWVLAARDARCVVVETHTELEWAMKNGQSCVWAPSKIVLDAVAGPSVQPSDAVALAAWFASTYHASELLVIGADLPADASVPLRAVSVQDAVL